MSSDYITASFDTLLGQASDAATSYLKRARHEIDEMFGEGYAEKNPILVAAFVKTAASDMDTSMTGKIFGNVLQEISERLGEIAQSIEQNKKD